MPLPGQTTIPPIKHSGVGIASFVISITAGLAMFLVFAVAGLLQSTISGGIAQRPVANTIIGLFIIVLLMSDVVAIGLGIAGILQRERKRLFPILGIMFASATVVGTIFLILIGLIRKEGDVTKDADVIKGAQALIRKDGSAAVEAFTSASRKFPRNDVIFVGLGRAYGMLRDDDRARQNYERAVEVNPRNAEAWTYLGATLNEREPSKAVEACKKATELQPANATAWFILGLTYESQKNFLLAIPALERAVQVKPDFTEAWSTLADAYSVTGDYKRSSDARRRAADLKARNVPDNLKDGNQLPSPRSS